MSAKSKQNVRTAIEWIPGAITYLIAVVIISRFLIHELKKRKKEDTKFTTKSLQYLSLISMITALTANLFFSLNEVYGICVFATLLANIIFSIQMLLMGFYQLSRLYYCFSNNQIHSNKGYSKWVFAIMISIGLFLMIDFILLVIIYNEDPYIQCGINSKLEFYYVSAENLSVKYLSLWVLATTVVYLIWDITTLCLYYYKIRSFREMIKDKHEIVYKRVLFILHHIFILTLLYEVSLAVMTVLLVTATFLTDIIWIHNICLSIAMSVTSVSVCISMYLMMDHNKLEYIKFLKCIKKLKIHWICCNCREIVTEQLLELDNTCDLSVANRKNTEMTDQDHSLPKPLTRPRQASPATATITEQ